MAKMTLLQMVQDILNDISGDQVSDVGDTVESLQVAQIIKTTYYDLCAELGITGHSEVFKLTAFGDTTNPTKMQIDDDVSEIFWIKYNKKTSAGAADNYQDVDYLEPLEFMNKVNERDSSASNVEKVTGQGIDILVYNDQAPSYWTSFDDKIIVMDAYDSGVDNSLQASKTQAYGIKEPTWNAINTFTPDLAANLFPMFLAQCKLAVSTKLQGSPDAFEASKLRKEKIRFQTTKRRVKDSRYISSPDYGRK